ncbi:hypothetical protein NliqN6_1219 [Naganishia liquefaciens]|uniref:Clathrin/coatomer adaptor adaptin-like N-terminal domain-containing protein n=1 Tax=Naganishia liquefaciens TaxID=104408 RepID=A0A8H3TPH7_9TREE|nr:hypothetical protein NliqN6_1219 [Naganishia liquefaciens]
MALQSINSNVSRLTQRITENFKESTRDIPLFQGTSNASAAYFEYNHDKLKDISWLLEGGGDKSGAGASGVSAVTSGMRGDAARLEGMKRLIAMISKGRDMSAFFAQVVKQVASPSIEIRKLVYIYLLRYARNNTDLLLLSINTFQKDLSDPSPLIRSMSLRVLTSIRLPVIQGILMIGLKKLAADRNPWVRKTVALGLPKVYDMDSTTRPLLLPILSTLLQSPSPITLGASLTAFDAICPDNLAFLHPHYRRICRLLVDADEWGQIVALDILIRYCREMLEKPESSGDTKPPDATEPTKQNQAMNGNSKDDGGVQADEEDELDPDIELLLHCALPLFQSRNSAVVLGNVKLFYFIAPASHDEVAQNRLVRPLLRLLNGLESDEVRAITAEVCRQVAEERPWLLSPYYGSFLLLSTDSIRVKRTKIRILNALLCAENAETLMSEFREYVRFPEAEVSQDAIKAVGHCARTQQDTRKLGLGILIRLLNSTRDASVGHAVVVLKSLVEPDKTPESVSESIKLVARLVRQLPEITNGSARACVYWLAGQYAEKSQDSETATPGAFEGLQPWAPDTLRLGAKEFIREPPLAKLQILTLAAKLLVICPESRPIQQLLKYVFDLARYDDDWDVRDRARFLKGLLRSILQSADPQGSSSLPGGEDDQVDSGGVVLRREQIKMVLLAAKEASAENSSGIEERRQADFVLGTLSSLASRRLANYNPPMDWTDDPTDPSLRDVEEEKPVRPFIDSRTVSATQTPLGIASPALAQSGGGSPVSAGMQQRLPPVQAKARFQNLDDFLNESEGEDESEESGEEPSSHAAEAESTDDSSGSEDVTDEESEDENVGLVEQKR